MTPTTGAYTGGQLGGNDLEVVGGKYESRYLALLRLRFPDDDFFYWQNKSRREVDFVIRRGRDRVDVIECKINPDKLDPKPFDAFHSLYPEGEN